MKSEWVELANKLGVAINRSLSPSEIRDLIAANVPNFRNYLRDLT